MAVDMINGHEVAGKVTEGVSVVNIFGTWCGPCKMFAPILEELSEEMNVMKIDVDQNQEFAREMQIQGVPSTFIYKDGVLKDTIVGFVPMDALKQRITNI